MEHHLTYDEVLKYCNKNTTKLLSKEVCMSFFTHGGPGASGVFGLANHILTHGVMVVRPKGDITEISAQTTMFMDLMRSFMTFMFRYPAHPLIRVVPFILQDPFFISALKYHIADQPSNGSCDLSMIDLAQATAKYVNYVAFDSLVHEKFFNHFVKLLYTKRLHVTTHVLECMLFFIATKNEAQLGLSITLALCRESVGLLAGLQFLLREFEMNQLQSFQGCTHYENMTVFSDPVKDLMFVLYEVC